MVNHMTDAELAFRTGELFNQKITAVFWDSFRGEYGAAQAKALVYLYDHGQAKAAELALALDVPKQHISKMAKGFAADGLVETHPCPGDQRANLLALTAKGKVLLQKHYAVSNAYFDNCIKTLTPEQARKFTTAMQQMCDILEIL